MSIKHDTHLHTSFSLDSETPMADQIEQAIKLGFEGICFTDHIDFGFPPDQCPELFNGQPFTFDFDNYSSTINLYREKYDRIEIYTGVECGLQIYPEVVKDNTELCSDPELDQVIGSIHLIDKKDPYYPSFWEGKNVNDVMNRYFELTLLNLQTFDNIDTLGHLDYAARYIGNRDDYKPENYFEITDEVMRCLIDHDIALEINTSPLKKGFDTINPNPALLERYYMLGGRLITIGSDAHTTDAMGFGFKKAYDILNTIGFKEYVTYIKRKPVIHPL